MYVYASTCMAYDSWLIFSMLSRPLCSLSVLPRCAEASLPPAGIAYNGLRPWGCDMEPPGGSFRTGKGNSTVAWNYPIKTWDLTINKMGLHHQTDQDLNESIGGRVEPVAYIHNHTYYEIWLSTNGWFKAPYVRCQSNRPTIYAILQELGSYWKL